MSHAPDRRWSGLGVIAAILVSACASDNAPPSDLMRPRDLKALASLPADLRVAYGSDPRQHGDLRIPAGPGPHPVAVLVHGGCFKYSDLSDLAPMADALKAEGIASWNIEYRRLADPGGGWPGTFLDVGAAIDHLRTLAPTHNLDLGRVVLVGHSAGGQLAHWAASRSRLPEGSPLRSGTPLVPVGIVNLAGPIDLADNIAHYETMCREAVIAQLIGGTPAALPDRYADASPNRRLPLGVPQVLVWGEHEDFVPRPLAIAYVRAARRAGDSARLALIPRAGHFEIASPRAASWSRVRTEILSLLSRRREPGASARAPQLRWETVEIPGTGRVRTAIVRPRGPGPFPSVLILHGSHGFGREYVDLAHALAERGLLAVAACWFGGGDGPGRRVITPLACPEGAPPRPLASSDQAFRTIDALMRAVRALPETRDDQVALFGHSRGGGAAVNYVLLGGRAEAVIANSAGYSEERAARIPQMDVPMLILHGTADGPADGGSEYTHVAMARMFEAALRAAGKPVEAVYYPGGRHGSLFTSRSQREDEVRRISHFLGEIFENAGSERSRPKI